MYFLSKRQTFLPVDTVQVVPLHINVGEVASTERRVISRGGGLVIAYCTALQLLH